MFVLKKTHVVVLLIFATLFPFILLRTFAHPFIQSNLKEVVMDNLKVVGHKRAELMATWMRERMSGAIVVSSNPYMINRVNVWL